jgi:hypothetical protein
MMKAWQNEAGPIKTYRCSKGHEWKDTGGLFIGTSHSDESKEKRRVQVCLDCLIDWITENLGSVQEVN